MDTDMDEATFADLTEAHRRELRVHCYRLLGSTQDAEDLVQETFLRAWRGRETYAGRATFRAWLYKIATNACLDVLDRRPPVAEATPSAVFVPWLTPCPADFLDELVVSRETVELAFLTALQHLPPRQRAALVLRDVLGWSAKETAELLDTTVASANSALQRARETLRDRLPAARAEWTAPARPAELAVARRYMAALESGDEQAIGAMLAEDAGCGQAPGAGGNDTGRPFWYQGRATLLEGWAPALRGEHRVAFRCVLTSANHQPAVATYVRGPGSGGPFEAFGLTVLRVTGDRIAELAVFGTDLYPRFGLPPRTS
jgi:RNA polymerase sigma-70 factor (ECF subfamily)